MPRSGASAPTASARVLIVVVPFFENEGLVEVVCPSLEDCGTELVDHRACVLLVNDSPGYEALRIALRRWADRLRAAGIDVVLFEAERNGGFIRSTNIGLRCADLLSCPCLMLNSDAQLHRGSLSEMLHVASLDDKFAFVNPPVEQRDDRDARPRHSGGRVRGRFPAPRRRHGAPAIPDRPRPVSASVSWSGPR